MLKELEDMLNYYDQQDEDSRLKMDRAHCLEYLTTIKYLDKICDGHATILDACAGTGAYCFYIAEKGHTVTAGNIHEILNQFYTGKRNVFYRSTPTEIEDLMVRCQVTKKYNISTDGLSFMYNKQLQSISEEEFNEYLNYHYDTCENANILGYSLHGLFIGEK